jgi:hypothetical protein
VKSQAKKTIVFENRDTIANDLNIGKVKFKGQRLGEKLLLIASHFRL